MVKTLAVSTEGESWLRLPVGNGSEQTPSAGARGRTEGPRGELYDQVSHG